MQDEEMKVLLRRNLEVARENNKLLKKMRRTAIYGNILRVIWWAIIIGVPVAIYYYVLQPYFVELSQTYDQVRTGVGNIEQFFNRIPIIGNFLGDMFNGGVSTSTPPAE